MQDELKAQVFKTIDQDLDYLTGLVQDLVRIPSVNPKFEIGEGLNRETDVQLRLQPELDRLGFKTDFQEVFPHRPNLIGCRDGNPERSLILNGHIDVVPIGEASAWTVNPFGGDLSNGKIYGRGSVDMKGGVAAAVAAVRAINVNDIELDGALDFHSVVDEEAGGFGAVAAAQEKRRASAVIVAEPTWGTILPAEGGLEWVRVTIQGRAGHAGWRFNEIFPQRDTPERLVPAVNAIELGTRFLSALADFERDRTRRLHHPLTPPGLNTINPGAVHGGVGIGENGLPITVSNPAMIPDTFVVDLDYKFLPNEQSSDVRAEFEAFVDAFARTDSWLRDHPPKIEWDLYGLHFPAMNTPVGHPIIKALENSLHQLGEAPEMKAFEAVCDAAHYAGAGMDSVIYGPSGDGFHSVDEYVTVESLALTAKAIAGTIIEYCGVRKSTN
ncbi:MAG: ArgE/DapE family deacylase [Pseudomonadota bacterium]